MFGARTRAHQHSQRACCWRTNQMNILSSLKWFQVLILTTYYNNGLKNYCLFILFRRTYRKYYVVDSFIRNYCKYVNLGKFSCKTCFYEC